MSKSADLFRFIELFILENELPIYKDDMAVKNGQLSKSNIEKKMLFETLKKSELYIKFTDIRRIH